ncbi:MAG: type I-C CRISPR-associated protein Cas8c/Csd1 [Oscillospiraceae bacterium]|nr:type I-C CRISPR-associated protein Cas8c/Csd1 [Oscillospiraceae bacterium]
MILQALVDYYEALAQKGEIARPGWAKVKVSYALEIDEDGQLLQVHPLKTEVEGSKKAKPREMMLPAPIVRTAGIGANFLYDNAAYLLGIDGKGNPARAAKCFEEAKNLHKSLLGGLADPFAKAICNYFENWEISCARENVEVSKYVEDIEKGSNLVFMMDGAYPCENKALSQAWQTHYDCEDGEGAKMRCLITGEEIVPGSIHPSIKGVWGAQSSGATLISFNAPAYCSYHREQNSNAPVGKYAAFAYTTALNHLLAEKGHVKRMGDTTLVYWAEDAEPVYQDAFSSFLDGGNAENPMTDGDMDSYMDAISKGNAADWGGIPLNPANRFYVLGLAPNAARLSVRFFLRDEFGGFVGHIQEHYKNLEIVSDNRSRFQNIPVWALLHETVNEKSNDKSSSPQMTGDTLRAILTGGRYPATLYQRTQLRIKAERTITRGRAAIIKAYLIRNTDVENYKGALQVELNERTTYQPYVLGRLFSVAEAIQEKASGVTTIKDRYFSSAGTTPAVVFPIILKLAETHLKKLDGGMRVYYAKQLGELVGLIRESYPKHYGLYEQGIFQLGYYHQTQKRYEKKEKPENTANTEENKEGK